MITGKNKEQFEMWCKVDFLANSPFTPSLIGFYKLPFEMQLGVYLAYYESLGYDVDVFFMPLIKRYGVCVKGIEFMYQKTRNEAYKEAFKEADKIVNNQLNK